MTEQDIRTTASSVASAVAGAGRGVPGVWSRETIDRFVHECHEQLREGAQPGLNFAGLHAGRFARERLWALAQAEGHRREDRARGAVRLRRTTPGAARWPPRYLSCRRREVRVRSAGSRPPRDHPAVVEAMEEIGVDVTQEFPKPLTDEVVRAADVVVTMGCGDACPVYPGKRYEDWEVDDPAGQDLDTVRAIRDELDRRVQSADRRAASGRAAGAWRPRPAEPCRPRLAAPSGRRGTRHLRAGLRRLRRDRGERAVRRGARRRRGSLVFGLIIMVMVYATGHLSGAHINPAVTIAFTLSRHFPGARCARVHRRPARRRDRWSAGAARRLARQARRPRRDRPERRRRAAPSSTSSC